MPRRRKTTLPTEEEPQASSGGGRSMQLCAFFASSGGCRAGDACRYSHVLPSSSSKPEQPPQEGFRTVGKAGVCPPCPPPQQRRYGGTPSEEAEEQRQYQQQYQSSDNGYVVSSDESAGEVGRRQPNYRDYEPTDNQYNKNSNNSSNRQYNDNKQQDRNHNDREVQARQRKRDSSQLMTTFSAMGTAPPPAKRKLAEVPEDWMVPERMSRFSEDFDNNHPPTEKQLRQQQQPLPLRQQQQQQEEPPRKAPRKVVPGQSLHEPTPRPRQQQSRTAERPSPRQPSGFQPPSHHPTVPSASRTTPHTARSPPAAHNRYDHGRNYPSNKGSSRLKEDAPSSSSAQPPLPTFRTLNLPVTEFMAPASTQPASSPPASSPPKVYPLPKSNKVGRQWLSCVQRTQAHERFAEWFDFEAGVPWITARPYGDWCRDNPQTIAIDCEMCATEDPHTKRRNDNALCRISVVDAETDEVLLNTLVKPAWPVVDARTFVNGITVQDLEPVQFTLAHAHMFLQALCSEETVILGHAVNNDLKALQMEHYCVADSACLYRSQREGRLVSLKDLCHFCLEGSMPEVHDSVNDARVALKCVEYYRERDGVVDLVPKIQAKRRGPNTPEASKLFLHRIPVDMQKEDLVAIFVKATGVTPVYTYELKRGEKSAQTNMVFESIEEANRAFENIGMGAATDGKGYPCKRVYLGSSGHFIARKKVLEDQGGK